MHLKDTSSDGFLFHKTNEVRLDLQSYQKMVHIIHRRIWSYSHKNLPYTLSDLNIKFRKLFKQKNLPRTLIAVNQPDQCRSLTCAISSLWFIFLSEFIMRKFCHNCPGLLRFFSQSSVHIFLSLFDLATHRWLVSSSLRSVVPGLPDQQRPTHH